MHSNGYDVGSIGMAICTMLLNILAGITLSGVLAAITILAGLSTLIYNVIKIRKELKNEKSSSVHKDE